MIYKKSLWMLCYTYRAAREELQDLSEEALIDRHREFI